MDNGEIMKKCSNCRHARTPVLSGKGYVGCQRASIVMEVEEKIIATDGKIGDHYMYWKSKLNSGKKGVMRVGVCVSPEYKCFMWEESK